jgi:hypothetical protein
VQTFLLAFLFKKEISEDLLTNNKIDYFWKYVKYFKIFDFDLLYSFDECSGIEDWHPMFSVFKKSPCCRFLISFNHLKPQIGQKKSLETMLD